MRTRSWVKTAFIVALVAVISALMANHKTEQLPAKDPLKFELTTFDGKAIRAEVRVRYDGEKACAQIYLREALTRVAKRMSASTFLEQAKSPISLLAVEVGREYGFRSGVCRLTHAEIDFGSSRFFLLGGAPQLTKGPP